MASCALLGLSLSPLSLPAPSALDRPQLLPPDAARLDASVAPRAAVLLLGFCGDVASPPNVSAAVLADELASLSHSALHRVMLLLDDRSCAGRCKRLPLHGAECYSATDMIASGALNATAVVEREAVSHDAQLSFTWQAMLPAVISQRAFHAYAHVWAIELDVFYSGDWAALLSRFDDPRSPWADVDLITSAAVQQCFPISLSCTMAVPPSAGRSGNLAQHGFSMYHAPLMMSRFSARLVAASVAATDAGLWAYMEEWWPSVCHTSLHGSCSTYALDRSGLTGTPFTCCPTCNEELTVMRELVMPVAHGRPPVGIYANVSEPGVHVLLHPVKWEVLSNATLAAAFLNSSSVKESLVSKIRGGIEGALGGSGGCGSLGSV